MNKNEITLQEAHTILENCSAIVIDDNILLYPSLEDLTGEPENEFLYLSWNEEGEDFEVKFLEKDNPKVTTSGCSLFLVDTEGNENQITILSPQKLS